MATAEHMRQSSIKHRKNQEYFAAKHRKERALLVDWQSYCLHIQFSRGQHRQWLQLFAWLAPNGAGVRQQIIYQGIETCLICGKRDTNEHIMMACNYPKSQCNTRGLWLTELATVQNSKAGTCVSPPVWIDYIEYALSQETEEFQIYFAPCTLERINIELNRQQ